MNIDNIFQLHQVKPPQDNVPKTKSEREEILRIVRDYIADKNLVCPLSIDELRKYSEQVVNESDISKKYCDFIAVLLNNETWRETVGGIPFDKRLLLLPKCLCNHEKCRAGFDHFGLICEHCGNCMIDDFKKQAEKIGYAVLVAEGSPIVMSLIESGKVEAVIGVSCLSVLERTFPYMEAGAVPGIAIPLLYEGCKDTTADADWVWDAIYQTSEKHTDHLDLQSLRTQVDSWFTKYSLKKLLDAADSSAENLAIEWLSGGGKRWRPFLAVGAYKALCGDTEADLPPDIKKLALAVECFHKASLIHDDIEDDDSERYGRETLHVAEGIPIALNVGDLLLGEGYRLISETGSANLCCCDMIAAAAAGHRDLCLGQGAELAWTRNPEPLTVQQVLDIFARKTSPAFAVALKIGAIYAGADQETIEILDEYSNALGIAYQIRDDIDDFSKELGSSNTALPHLSLLLAMAYSKAADEDKEILKSLWVCEKKGADMQDAIKSAKELVEEMQIVYSAGMIMESYKARAIASLCRLKSSKLKILLRRVLYKIFNDTKTMGCCNDDKTGPAESGGEF